MCAAQAMGRSFVGTEISKDYHRQSIERLQMQCMEVA
jgi:DNA modification methylase